MANKTACWRMPIVLTWHRVTSGGTVVVTASLLPSGSRYKTELCRSYEELGYCKYGEKCQFAHGTRELRSLVRHPKYRTEPCRTFHSTGLCPYGLRCHFIHNAVGLHSR